jgi:hypothetical protein
MTREEITLGEYGPDRIFLVSLGIPAGIEIDLTSVADPDPGERDPLDPLDVESALPAGCWGLSGSMEVDGTWCWDGRGEARDWNNHAITRLEAWRV